MFEVEDDEYNFDGDVVPSSSTKKVGRGGKSSAGARNSSGTTTKRNPLITPEQINDMLTDRYHRGISVNELKEKYGISHSKWRDIDKKFSPAFIKKFGATAKPTKDISVDDMNAYWSKNK